MIDPARLSASGLFAPIATSRGSAAKLAGTTVSPSRHSASQRSSHASAPLSVSTWSRSAGTRPAVPRGSSTCVQSITWVFNRQGTGHGQAGLGTRARHEASRTRFLSRPKPARPYICRLSILILLTWPSTTPELQGSVRPAMTASRSRSMPLARVWRLGRSSCLTESSQSCSRWPWRSVSMVAKERTSRVSASSSGQLARTFLSRTCSDSVRDSGRRRIYPATVRGEGGRADTGPRAWPTSPPARSPAGPPGTAGA